MDGFTGIALTPYLVRMLLVPSLVLIGAEALSVSKTGSLVWHWATGYRKQKTFRFGSYPVEPVEKTARLILYLILISMLQTLILFSTVVFQFPVHSA